MKKNIAIIVVSVLMLAAPLNLAAEEPLKVGTTLENLQASYNGESNAKARYEAFAVKADAEGYTKAGSLFRAAAKAEEVHAASHAKVIQKLGGKPAANVQQPEVKSTRENLETALKGETYERDTMYPAFIKAAQVKGDKSAVTTFNHALKAEGQHAEYYAEALSSLEAWKGGTKDFAVCPECGNTTTDPSFKNCPVCGEPRRNFVAVK